MAICTMPVFMVVKSVGGDQLNVGTAGRFSVSECKLDKKYRDPPEPGLELGGVGD
jgi:hypothetical protein